MEIEEAIEALKGIKDFFDGPNYQIAYPKDLQALDMSIKFMEEKINEGKS